MTKTPRKTSPDDQRETLERSESEAASKHPKNYREEENDDKVVEIGPDLQDAPIHGLDPDERERDER